MHHHRIQIALTLVIVVAAAACGETESQPESQSKEPKMTAHESSVRPGEGIIGHTVTSLEGDTIDLEGYRGRPMLIVNTASKCGYTKQYDTLQQLYEEYSEQGFVVIGFPSNDFGNQEPGTHEEIAEFCRLNYGVTFPMMAKVHTKGPEQAPIYRTLTTETGAEILGEIKWNFTKFLVDGDGRVVARFEPAVDPMSDEVVTAVEALLSQAG